MPIAARYRHAPPINNHSLMIKTKVNDARVLCVKMADKEAIIILKPGCCHV